MIIVKVTTDESSSLTQHMSHHKAGGAIAKLLTQHMSHSKGAHPRPSLGVTLQLKGPPHWVYTTDQVVIIFTRPPTTNYRP